MDQNNKIYNLLDQASFNQWMTEFFNKKSNQLEYSITSQPKRMEKLTLDLSTANSSGYKVPVPFKSCVVSRIYSTATGTDKAGSVRILFDQPNIGNLKNAVNLFVNDTLTGETLFSESYLLWDAQADTTIEIYFFPDIQVSTGTTKTQIVGNVSVTNSSSLALYNRSVIPTATYQSYVVNGTNSNFYTVPAGKFAVVKCTLSPTNNAASILYFNGTATTNIAMRVDALINTSAVASQTFIFKAGDVLTLFASNASSTATVYIEEYTII